MLVSGRRGVGADVDDPSWRELADRLGVEFRDLIQLRAALAHRSWCAENGGVESNERLEFLGDAVLGLVVTTHLFRAYPTFPEGELAKIRAAVVSSVSLAEVAIEIDLGRNLLLGKGENLSGGREKRSILADAVEAVIGAVYLDSGWDAAEALIMRLVGDRIIEAAAGPGGHDYKTRLQEFTAHRYEHVPRYEITDHGPDHAKRFFATVVIGDEERGSGEGRSKKAAEQAAAHAAWYSLQSEERIDGPEFAADADAPGGANAPENGREAGGFPLEVDRPEHEVDSELDDEKS